MSPPERPLLFTLEAAGRRRRRLRLRASAPLVALVVVLGVLGGGGLYVLDRIGPLLEEPRDIVAPPPAARRGGSAPAPQQGGAGVPAGLWAAEVSHTRIPGVRARAAIVVDRVTGRVLWARRAHEPRPVASLTKLITTLVAERRLRPQARFRITPEMTDVPPFGVGLEPGERVRVRDMLAAALVVSANDAAAALAVRAGGSVPGFVRIMNREARRMTLRDSRFSNPSGIYDAGNHSSAWDVADLARRLLRRPLLARLVGTRTYATGPTTQYINRNRLLWTYRGAVGVKTGFTSAAGYCLAAAAERDGRSVVAVVLDAGGSPFREASRLLDWGLRRARR